jgi:tRNA threonylcarbamoyl adenosine modification protein YeaZ
VVLVLVLDTSTPAVMAALVRVEDSGVELLEERRHVNARAHGELLAPAIEHLVAKPHDLAAIVAGLGPGPFTGLRVGLVTAAAMGHALGIPTYGVCSLDGIGARTSGVCLVATDARRREIYWAVYGDGQRVGEPAVNRPAEVLALAEPRPVQAAGDGAVLYADVLGLPVQAEPRYPEAAPLAGAALDRIRTGAPSQILTPLYLRRPDAVEPGARKLVGT